MKLTLIADNEKPDKAPETRRLPKVSPYCPVCGSNTWISVNVGPANRTGQPMKKRACVDCLAKGVKTVW